MKMKIGGRIFKLSTLIHIIVWAVIFSLPYIFSPPGAKNNPQQNALLGFITSTTVVWMAMFYLNEIVLIPRFLFSKKYTVYFVLQFVCYCIVVGIFWFLFKIFIPKFPFNLLSAAGWNILPFLLTITVSTTYKTIYEKIKADAILEEKQKENLKTELSFLRSQISPHFVFNVLNNIVSLVRLKSDDLEPTVLKLSSLMQYMLYDTDEEKVLLVDEVHYLQSYIDLQEQRFGSKVKISASLYGGNGTYLLEPMLLIPFVENAFKHGVGLIDKPVINISLDVKENMLHFSVENKFNVANNVKDKTSGIGLVNVQRRLELLYGKDYSLVIKKEDDLYVVFLQIKLK